MAHGGLRDARIEHSPKLLGNLQLTKYTGFELVCFCVVNPNVKNFNDCIKSHMR